VVSVLVSFPIPDQLPIRCLSRDCCGSPLEVRVRPAPRDRRVAAGPEGGRSPPAGPALRKSRGSCNEPERAAD